MGKEKLTDKDWKFINWVKIMSTQKGYVIFFGGLCAVNLLFTLLEFFGYSSAAKVCCRDLQFAKLVIAVFIFVFFMAIWEMCQKSSRIFQKLIDEKL